MGLLLTDIRIQSITFFSLFFFFPLPYQDDSRSP